MRIQIPHSAGPLATQIGVPVIDAGRRFAGDDFELFLARLGQACGAKKEHGSVIWIFDQRIYLTVVGEIDVAVKPPAMLVS